eukprot:gene45201-49027_t
MAQVSGKGAWHTKDGVFVDISKAAPSWWLASWLRRGFNMLTPPLAARDIENMGLPWTWAIYDGVYVPGHRWSDAFAEEDRDDHSKQFFLRRPVDDAADAGHSAGGAVTPLSAGRTEVARLLTEHEKAAGGHGD